ncbi:MAG: helix-turn-helix transcriptional regulator [Armatimonadota bacterium]
MRPNSGVKHREPGYISDIRDQDHFQLLYLLDGELCLAVQNSLTTIHAHELLVLPYHSTYRLHCTVVGYTAVYVSILDELTEEYAGEAMIFPGTPAIRTLAGLIHDEVRHPGYGTGVMRQHLGKALATLALRMLQGNVDYTRGLPVTAETWAQTARRYIEETCYTSQSLIQSLAGIPLSYQQLARHFQTVYGQTPKQYQLQCRIHEAQRLLQTTRLSITTIAAELGFASSQHFALVFKRSTGICPSMYRGHGRYSGDTIAR